MEQRVYDQLLTVLAVDVLDEAHRAHEKHADASFLLPNRYTDDERLKYLVEEVGEVARALCDGDRENLRDELVQVTHLAALWVAVMDVKNRTETFESHMMEEAVDASR